LVNRRVAAGAQRPPSRRRHHLRPSYEVPGDLVVGATRRHHPRRRASGLTPTGRWLGLCLTAVHDGSPPSRHDWADGDTSRPRCTGMDSLCRTIVTGRWYPLRPRAGRTGGLPGDSLNACMTCIVLSSRYGQHPAGTRSPRRGDRHAEGPGRPRAHVAVRLRGSTADRTRRQPHQRGDHQPDRLPADRPRRRRYRRHRRTDTPGP